MVREGESAAAVEKLWPFCGIFQGLRAVSSRSAGGRAVGVPIVRGRKEGKSG